MNAVLAQSGFVPVEEGGALALRNVRPCVNEFSAFARVEEVETAADAPLVVDAHYGQVYDELPLRPTAIYGATADLPGYAIDAVANHGFLRVPFRRIPRRIVRSYGEFTALVKPLHQYYVDRGMPFLFRGQNREFTLKRAPEVREWLYGEADVVEPSLPASAMRKGVDPARVAPLWNGVLAQFLQDEYDRAVRDGRADVARELLEDKILLGNTYWFHLFATALAQHYGLPTTGLDLTSDPRVALFFAITDLKADQTGTLRAERLTIRKDVPVVYVLTPPVENTNAYSTYGPREIGVNRPRAQAAHFLHTGWGMSTNDAARRILLAVYLDFDFGRLVGVPTAPEMFPGPEDDRFGAHVERLKAAGVPADLKAYLEGLYWVRD